MVQPRSARPRDASSGEPTSASKGNWFFRNRSWLPVPGALALVGLTAGEVQRAGILPAGAALVSAGLAMRLWAVRHIGVISRTRAARLGPLITTGPYDLTRNPLYIANFLVWTGIVVMSRLLWMLPVAWLLFVVQYAAIVRWEEALLQRAYGGEFTRYQGRVHRWRPRWTWPRPPAVPQPWRAVLFSERGTLLAVAAMSLLLLAKRRWIG